MKLIISISNLVSENLKIRISCDSHVTCHTSFLYKAHNRVLSHHRILLTMQLYTIINAFLLTITGGVAAYGQMSNMANRRLQTALGMLRAEHRQLVVALIYELGRMEPGEERNTARRRFLDFVAHLPMRSVSIVEKRENDRRARYMRFHS